MKKLEQIERQEQKTREKIAALQDILKDIGKQRTEQEDLQIIQKFRALKLSREELYTFLGGGELPSVLAAAVGNATTDTPERIYSQSGRKRRKGQNTADEPDNTPDTGTVEGETADHEGNLGNEDNNNGTEPTNFESEGMNNEEQ